MSRFMQIRLRLEPEYRPDLNAHFPKLTKALDEIGIEKDPSSITLYDLIRELQRSLYGEMRTALKQVLEKHLAGLLSLRDAVEEKIAAWKLEGLDELLYRIEDAFEELEHDLD